MSGYNLNIFPGDDSKELVALQSIFSTMALSLHYKCKSTWLHAADTVGVNRLKRECVALSSDRWPNDWEQLLQNRIQEAIAVGYRFLYKDKQLPLFLPEGVKPYKDNDSFMNEYRSLISPSQLDLGYHYYMFTLEILEKLSIFSGDSSDNITVKFVHNYINCVVLFPLTKKGRLAISKCLDLTYNIIHWGLSDIVKQHAQNTNH